MDQTGNSYIYKVEDIFEEIPDDPENVMLKLPPEVCEEIGLEPGDKMKILLGDQGTIIIEKLKDEDG
jgi:hypothetical protein